MALIKLCIKPKISKCSLSLIFPVFRYVLEQVSNATLRENWIISVIASHNKAMSATWWKVIVHHHATGCFDWLISEQ